MWIQLLILGLIDGGGNGVVTPPTPSTPASTGGGGRARYFTPYDDKPPVKKRKRREPEIIVKDDVVIETVFVDFAGIVGSVEEVKVAMLDEEKRIEARRKRAKNKALILLMLS